MNIALLGYGKMGKTIEKLALQKGDQIVYTLGHEGARGNLTEADVAIEFSAPEVAVENIQNCFEAGIPVVSGTTGWLDRYEEVLKKCQACNGSFIYASNFSIGVNLFFKLNQYLAQLMAPWTDYQVAIEEVHHTEKQDAPSGTAITLAEDVLAHTQLSSWKLGEGSDTELGITALRVPDVKGTHTVEYRSEIDELSIKHHAHSREGFALGALLAAAWLRDKTGVFSMDDVLKV